VPGNAFSSSFTLVKRERDYEREIERERVRERE